MGRPRVPDRAALTGILFVLRSGLPWQMLPKEMGCGSGSTCWRRLVDCPIELYSVHAILRDGSAYDQRMGVAVLL